MTDWPSVRLEDLAADEKSAISKPYGSAFTAHDYVAEGVPMVRGVNLGTGRFIDSRFVFITEDKANQVPGANLQPGDLIFTHRGTIGQVAMIPRAPRFSRYVTSTSQVKARLDSARAVPEFYLYWFLSPSGQRSLLTGVSTVGVPGLAQPVATIKALRVPHPPIATQQAIAKILGALDAKIEVNDRIAIATDQYCAALFESVVSGSSTEMTELGQVAAVNARAVKPTRGGSLRYVDISSVGDGSLTWPERISWDEAPGRARRGVLAGDTLWSTVRPNRRSRALVLDDDPLLVASTGFAVITPRSVGPAFLYESTRTDRFVAYLESVAEGSAYPAVRAGKFLGAPIPDVPNECREKFEAQAFPLRLRAHSAVEENRVLASLRDTLLPELMSGRLRVKHAEKVVEEAV